MPVAPDPFRTASPMTPQGEMTYKTIASRLRGFSPPILLEAHIAQHVQPGKTQFSTLEARDSTLDGINFIAASPAALMAAFRSAKDASGARALQSMEEDPNHWALKMSFMKTIGTGWREVWRPAAYGRSAGALNELGTAASVMSMRFGTARRSINFSALHCAVRESSGECNIHIDESGFVIDLPTTGIALTPNFYDHFMNELLLKTEFRDWLAGRKSHQEAARLVGEVVRRLSIVFPSAANGFAGLGKTINNIRKPAGPGDVLWTAARVLRPVGATANVYDSGRVKVQVTGSMVGGDCSITISVDGDW